MFKHKKLSTAVIGILAATAATTSLAQGQENLEEVYVTGIRASLEASMDIKRESAGVVDAISAEDIGKFPDTNLAESLQRITGVSIDRVNGEGSQVTVRGFGPEFNMITLNGRIMPAGSTFGGGSGAGGTTGGATRAFDFANLASEGVAGVEVYKTGRASIASGGIGATVNLKTTRPLDKEGMSFTVSGKAVHDSTVRIGDDFTPELSGLFSWSDGTFGASLAASYQERHSGSAGASENNWNIAQWPEEGGLQPGEAGFPLYNFPVDDNGNNIATIENAPAPGQLFARPNDFRWTYSDRERTRTNAQLTLQWAPTDTIEATLDYTYAENQLWEHRGEMAQWLDNGRSIDRVIFDNSPVKTPIYIHETHASGSKDVGYEQQLREQKNTLDSVGFNLSWQASDDLSFNFDVHDSSMDSKPDGLGGSGSVAISTGAPISEAFEYDFSKELPIGRFQYSGTFDPNTDVGTAQGRIWYARQKHDITQIQLDGKLEFDNGHFAFGVSRAENEVLQQSSNNPATLGNWNVTAPGELAPGTMVMFDFSEQYDDYDMSGQWFNMADVGARAVDVKDLCRQAEALYGEAQDWGCVIEDNFTSDNTIEENVTSLFMELAMEGELGDMPFHVLAGLRYEETDITSTARIRKPLHLIWQGNNDFQDTVYDDAAGKLIDSRNFDYSNMLPSFDFDIELRENLVGRFSFSNTIARANYGNLFSGVGNFGATNPTGFAGSQPTAARNNPGLKPLESDNLDLSLEWYFQEGSYASVGVFEKRVNNFIGTGIAKESHYGMFDPTVGPRRDQIEAELSDLGYTSPTADQLFARAVCVTYDTNFMGDKTDAQIAQLQAQCAIEDNWDPTRTSEDGLKFQPIDADGNGEVDGDGNPVLVNFMTWVEGPYDINAIMSDSDHPDFGPDAIAEFDTSYPTNSKEAKIYGSELAVQHFFGETGFGVQANYTLVKGDVGFNDLALPSEAQFALLGLSDTMNLVGIYEKYGFQIRVAYNWRDSFLRQTNQGGSRNPVYVDEYSQIDLNASYDINDNFNVFVEGLNLTGENVRWYQRSDHMTYFVEELGPRYQVGVRYTY